MLSRQQVVDTIQYLDLWLLRNARDATTGLYLIQGTSYSLERVYREERSPGCMEIYENASRVAWINLEDNGTFTGGGENVELFVQITEILD
jgi:hypothetical protein